MKTISVILFSVILFFNCNQSIKTADKQNNESLVELKKTNSKSFLDTIISFQAEETDKLPISWQQYFTGKGDSTLWKVIDFNGNKVMAQLSQGPFNYHFNEVICKDIQARNVLLSVRLKGVKGKMDKGGGLLWRFIDANNYYVVRANPLEDNVVLYKVKNGKRTDLPLLGKGKTYGVGVKPLGNSWNDLKVVVSDDIFTVFLNGEQIFKVKDETFKNAGKVGLWTKADAVTYFDDFQIKILSSK